MCIIEDSCFIPAEMKGVREEGAACLPAEQTESERWRECLPGGGGCGHLMDTKTPDLFALFCFNHKKKKKSHVVPTQILA